MEDLQIINEIKNKINIEANMKYMLNKYEALMQKYCNNFAGLQEREDLMQECAICLYECILNFDANAGASFMTYLYNSLKWKLCRCIKENTAMHVPSNVQDDVNKCDKLEKHFILMNGRKPDDFEMSILLGGQKKLENVQKARCMMTLKSLDESINDEDGVTLQDVIADESNTFEDIEHKTDHDEICKYLYSAISELDEKQRIVIVNEYLKGQNRSDIARAMKLPYSRIQSILYSAKNNLRHCKEAPAMKKYVEVYMPSSRIRNVSLAEFNRTFTSSVEMEALKDLNEL